MNNPDRFDALAIALAGVILALALQYLPGALRPAADAVAVYAGSF